MSSKKHPIIPSEQKLLADFGERMRLARLRRTISAETLADSILDRLVHGAYTNKVEDDRSGRLLNRTPGRGVFLG
ncbi:MAG: hypothetical protein M0Z37_03640 [Nitrospiraceae bacterium]|nr:hypothetical protein [Nitrospiraceae bacterium]